MTARITVNNFVHEPGKNDAEYIALLEEALKRQKEIVNKAIAKIKQSKPCDDAVSRQYVLDSLDVMLVSCENANLREVLKEWFKHLPSVTPVREKGHWREVYAETDYRNGWIEFSCEACEYQHGLESGQYGWHYGDPIPWKFCPICGAEMDGE